MMQLVAPSPNTSLPNTGIKDKLRDIFPALIYGVEGKSDKSFNFLAYIGAERFKKEYGVNYADYQNTNGEVLREQMLRIMIRKGHNPIVSVTYSFENSIKKVAKEFPHIKFIIFGAQISGPNIQSIIFRFDEASFLVGMLAAMTTQTGKVGVITACEVPLMGAFEYGFLQGVKHVDKSVNVVQDIIGNNLYTFRDPIRGGLIAHRQFSQGVDIVFPAAGATGLGVLQAAKEAGKLGIGYCANQNYLHPGNVLASMIECSDRVVYNAFREVMEGSWKPGTKWLGLKEHGVDWAVDKFNRELFSAEVEREVSIAKSDIINGKLSVIDYWRTRKTHKIS